jgi:hypothetical protein
MDGATLARHWMIKSTKASVRLSLKMVTMTESQIRVFTDGLSELFDKVVGFTAKPEHLTYARTQVQAIEAHLQAGDQRAAFDSLARLTARLAALKDTPDLPNGDDLARMKAESDALLTLELRQWTLSQYTTEEVIAALTEARQQGTFQQKDFIQDLEKVVKEQSPAAY